MTSVQLQLQLAFQISKFVAITQKQSLNRNSGVHRKFSWGVSCSGICWSFVFGMCCLWRHNLTSYPNHCFGEVCWHKRHAYSSTRTPLIMCHYSEGKISAPQVRISEENKLNATTQQFISAKISGCVLKQGSKTHTHHYVRAIYNCFVKSFCFWARATVLPCYRN